MRVKIASVNFTIEALQVLDIPINRKSSSESKYASLECESREYVTIGEMYAMYFHGIKVPLEWLKKTIDDLTDIIVVYDYRDGSLVTAIKATCLYDVKQPVQLSGFSMKVAYNGGLNQSIRDALMSKQLTYKVCDCGTVVIDSSKYKKRESEWDLNHLFDKSSEP